MEAKTLKEINTAENKTDTTYVVQDPHKRCSKQINSKLQNLLLNKTDQSTRQNYPCNMSTPKSLDLINMSYFLAKWTL